MVAPSWTVEQYIVEEEDYDEFAQKWFILAVKGSYRSALFFFTESIRILSMHIMIIFHLISKSILAVKASYRSTYIEYS